MMKANTNLSLNGSWSLRCNPAEEVDSNNMPESIEVNVPGDVLLDLMKAGIIDDPVVRDHHLKCVWVGQCEWIYEKHFTGDFSAGIRHELVCKGLIQVAEVFLNGKHIGSHKNMHRELRVDLSGSLLDKQDNLLQIRLQPFDLRILDTPEIKFWSAWDGAIYDKQLSVKRGASRKADYSYGWDWTQGLPICGIWQDIFIESMTEFRIIEPQIVVCYNKTISCSFVVDSCLKKTAGYDGEIIIRKRESGEIIGWRQIKKNIGPGLISYSENVQVDEPELWYPRGVGKQPLYEAEIIIGDISAKVKFAFREFKIVEKQFSEFQGYFCFSVNNREFFSRGANWVPLDIIPARVDEDRYRRAIELAVDCGINYFRVWGGGIYESDLFYDLCDEYGIIVWQDFMFGGSEIPEFDPEFRQECLAEAEYQIKRLRNHASVLIWCGSNETDEFYAPGGPRDPGPRPEDHYYGWRMFHIDIKELMGKLLPESIYFPSCPEVGSAAPDGASRNSLGFGTAHRNLCHQYSSDEEFDQLPAPTFMNEYYGLSPVAEPSRQRFLNSEDMDHYLNPVFREHNVLECQRNLEWRLFEENLCFHNYLCHNDWPMPEIFEYYEDAHCELLKRYVENMRRKRKYCSGSAIWMFNSAYPMMDFSLIDYYLQPKAAYYATKRAYANQLPIIALYNDCIDFYVSNCSGSDVTGTVECTFMDFNGNVIWNHTITDIKILADSSDVVFRTRPNDITGFETDKCFALVCWIGKDGNRIYNHRFFDKPRALKLPNAEVVIKKHPDRCDAIILHSGKFVSRLVIKHNENLLPNDNYFDLYPGAEKEIIFNHPVMELPEISWRNCPERHPYPIHIEKHKNGICRKLDITIFNPTKYSRTLSVQIEASALVWSCPDTVRIEPGKTALLHLEIQPNIFIDNPPIYEYTIHIGDCRIYEAEAFPWLPLVSRGIFSYRNIGATAMQAGGIEYRCLRRDGSWFESELPPVSIPPGDLLTFDFCPPEDILPDTAELQRNGKCFSQFWDTLVTTKQLLESFDLEAYTGEPLRAMHSSREFHLIGPEATGVFVTPATTAEYSNFGSEEGPFVALFLHYRARDLFIDIYVSGMPHQQEFSGEGVYCGSSVELLVGYDDNSEFRDYSLALTDYGAELYLRRGSEGFTKGISDDGELKVIHEPETQITAYHLKLDTLAAGMPNLLTTEAFCISINFCFSGGKLLRLFSGNIGESRVSKAGRVFIENEKTN